MLPIVLWRSRRLVSILLCAPALALLAACTTLPAQGLPPQATLVRYGFAVEGLENAFPQPGGGLIPQAMEAARTAGMIGEAARSATGGASSPTRQAMDAVYARVAAELARGGLQLQPVDRLRDRVPYWMGYPLGNPASLEAAGAPYLQIDVDVSVPDARTAHEAVLGSGRAVTRGHPELSLRLTLTDATGATLWSDETRQRTPSEVVLDERWRLGVLQQQSVTVDPDALPELGRRAAAELVERVRRQRGS